MYFDLIMKKLRNYYFHLKKKKLVFVAFNFSCSIKTEHVSCTVAIFILYNRTGNKVYTVIITDSSHINCAWSTPNKLV